MGSQKHNICIHLVFSPCKNEKGSSDELESDASQGFCDRIIFLPFLVFVFFFFLVFFFVQILDAAAAAYCSSVLDL